MSNHNVSCRRMVLDRDKGSDFEEVARHCRMPNVRFHSTLSVACSSRMHNFSENGNCLAGVYILHIIASHHCIHSSHSVVASGRPSLLVSLITLCVSSDRKCSRQVEEVDLFCFRSRNIVERFRTTASWTTPEWNPVMHLDGIPFRGCPRTDTC